MWVEITNHPQNWMDYGVIYMTLVWASILVAATMGRYIRSDNTPTLKNIKIVPLDILGLRYAREKKANGHWKI